ncbi:hypothetical protein OPKNFCMD_3511 [Methylobacterium crusticola]|uniref:Histidine kinase n=1 Tax=Methylobacterium crusticola TaxID=1697972 RepID=A0ABQ4R1P5_9HYPH|nr:histidine kinase [Methylobacterium crusticola]GJD50766.1 hypothetical protein OPKNFCMD_3511 [Methylobacterium crusticola]
MADYYPLLARALDALPDPSPEMRHTVYERARAALIGQLRSLDPPLSEADIEAERVSLDDAIGRLEAEHGGVLPAPAGAEPTGAEPTGAEPAGAAVMEPARFEPSPSEPVRVEAEALAPARRGDAPEAAYAEPDSAEPVHAEPALGGPALGGLAHRAAAFAELPERSFRPPEPPPGPEPLPEAHPADGLPEPGPPVELKVPVAPRPKAMPEPGEAEGEPAEDGVAAPRRPRIDVVKPKRDRSRLLRNGIVAAVLAAVVGAIAVAAWSLRDNPAALPGSLAETGPNRPAESQDSKFADRVGGERAPPAPASSTPAASGRGAPTPDIAVAQRATLYEEGGGPNNAPKATQGRVVWRLDAVNAGQGQPLQTVVRAAVEAPEAGLTLNLVLRRNTDATLPASHIVELAFVTTDPNRTVRDVGLIQFKDDESSRGSPVSGLPVPVRDNLFLIGLSNLKSDIDRNTDLILKRNWIDLPIRYAAGGRAILTFEKGSAGEKVLREAFEQWQP